MLRWSGPSLSAGRLSWNAQPHSAILEDGHKSRSNAMDDQINPTPHTPAEPTRGEPSNSPPRDLPSNGNAEEPALSDQERRHLLDEAMRECNERYGEALRRLAQ